MEQARKIKNYRGRSSLTGKFSSFKMKSPIPWESTLERDYIFLLEADSSVTAYKPQPFHLEYWLNGKRHSYTPDFWVERGSKKQVVEVKPKKRVEKYKGIFQSVTLVCQEKGWAFGVVTEDEIRVQPVLSNTKILCRYSRQDFSFDFLEYCRNRLKELGQCSLGELKDAVRTQGYPTSWIYTLMYLGIIGFDIGQAFNDNLMLKGKEAL